MNENRIIKFLIFLFFLSIAPLAGQDGGGQLAIPRIDINVEPARSPEQIAGSLQILLLMTVLTLAPSLLIMMTPFTRILIVLGFIRRAITTAQEPSNQTLIGLALFMTFYILSPTLEKINQTAVQPYLKKEMGYQEAFVAVLKPVREFMFRQVKQEDLALFISMERRTAPKNREEVTTVSLTAAFILSEVKVAFQMGVIIFLPFLVIDLVIASTLMAMGMVMLPPNTISLPFKILLFVMVDGWNLIIKALVESF